MDDLGRLSCEMISRGVFEQGTIAALFSEPSAGLSGSKANTRLFSFLKAN